MKDKLNEDKTNRDDHKIGARMDFACFYEKTTLYTKDGEPVTCFIPSSCNTSVIDEIMHAGERGDMFFAPKIAYGISPIWDSEKKPGQKNSFQHSLAALVSFLGMIEKDTTAFVVLNSQDDKLSAAIEKLNGAGATCLFDENSFEEGNADQIFSTLDKRAPYYCNMPASEREYTPVFIGKNRRLCAAESLAISYAALIQHLMMFIYSFALVEGEPPSPNNVGHMILTFGDNEFLTDEFVDMFNKLADRDVEAFKKLGATKYFNRFGKLYLLDIANNPVFSVSLPYAIESQVPTLMMQKKTFDDYMVMWECALTEESTSAEELVRRAKSDNDFDLNEYAEQIGMAEMVTRYKENGRQIYDVLRFFAKRKQQDPNGNGVIDVDGATDGADDSASESSAYFAPTLYERCGILGLASGMGASNGAIPDVDIERIMHQLDNA